MLKREKLLSLVTSMSMALLLVVLAFTGACATPAPAPTPAPPPSPSPAPAPAPSPPPTPAPAPSPPPTPAPPPKPIVLRYATSDSETGLTSQLGWIPWMKRIEDATKGRVKMVLYPSATISKPGSTYDDVVYGITHAGDDFPMWYPGRFPLADVLNLPFLGFENSWDVASAAWEMYEKFPEYAAEYKDVKVIMFMVSATQNLGTINKKVTKLEDLEGLKLRIGGKVPQRAMSLLGAVPMDPPWMEVQPMLVKGVLDGAQTNWVVLKDWKHIEAIKYVLWMPLWHSTPRFVIMNLDAWNNLSPDIQEAIMSVSGLKGSHDIAYAVNAAYDEQASKWAEEEGYTLDETYPTPEEIARWSAIGGKPLWDEWVAEMEAKGLPGQAVLDEALRLVKKYSK